MARDTKPFINPETPRVAFPVPRRASITASFSLPTLSLSSRSKATPPSLAPLDTVRTSSNPLDVDSASSSSITPSSSYPLPLSSLDPQTRPSSPLKPPASPGPSVPLPSIRSLRSRFSFSSPQGQANTPIQATPTQKRVVSRRFLPFGGSNSSTPTNSATPTVPRKSLGDVFALGRSSTSSRQDATSTRSATPSGRSSRSVTSAATLRGWTSSSKHLEPGGPGSRLSFGRPRSHDFSLDQDLGYVVAIESRDETIRQRPSVASANSSPLISGASLTVVESSQEDITQTTLGDVVTHVALPALAHRAVTMPVSTVANTPPSCPSDAAGSAANFRPSPRQSTLPPIVIPRPSLDKILQGLNAEQGESAKQAPVTAPESGSDLRDLATAAFPFTPIDDRSDVTSSTHGTPSSASNSVVRETRAIPPPLPSPSLLRHLLTETTLAERHTNGGDLTATQNPRADYFTSLLGGNALTQTEIPGGQTGTRLSPSKSLHREHALVGLSGELDGSLVALGSKGQPRTTAADVGLDPTSASRTSNSNVIPTPIMPSPGGAPGLFSVQEEPRSPPRTMPPSEYTSLETKVDSQRHRERIEQLSLGLQVAAVNGDHDVTSPSSDPDRLTGLQDGRLDSGGGSAYQLSYRREDPIAASARPPNDSDRNEQHLHDLDRDLLKLLSPHRLSPMPHSAFSAPPSASVPVIALPPASPARLPLPLPSDSWTPQPHPTPDHRPGSRAPHPASTPSPSTSSFRPQDIQIPTKPQRSTPSGAHDDGGFYSSSSVFNGTAASGSPYGADQKGTRELTTPLGAHSRAVPHRSPSVTAAMTRKRSASFDLSGSTTYMKDSSDPFAISHMGGPRRADWLGPRTAKAFAAAGLFDSKDKDRTDKDRTSPFSGTRSDVHRGAPWRTQHSERNAGLGSVRSHSRLGSEVISPSSRNRSLAGGDSSPSYGRRSFDHTAPPSPVSTHRTLVSSATSSSRSQQSVLQTMRERHDLETEALLLALAGSKKSERDLRVENEELLMYVAELERRIATLENERDQDLGKWRSRDRAWDTPTASDVDALDRRRQDILAGRPSGRGWSPHARVKSFAPTRSPANPANRPLPSPLETPRSASAALVFRSEFEAKSRSATPPTRRPDWADSLPSRAASASTPPIPRVVPPRVPTPDAEVEEWHEDSFAQSVDFNALQDGPPRLSSGSMASLLPQMPGSMSLLVQESGPLSEEDEYSFGSASPSSLTLVHPRNSTPKPCPPTNISPVTAEFSFNSIPGSPRSLRLRPEEEIHLADLISLQGLEIADVISDTD